MNNRRRLAWWSGGTLAMLMLVAGVSELFGWPYLHQPLQAAAGRAAGVAVRMEGGFELHLLGQPRLHVDHLQIAPAHALALPHLLDATQVDLAWRWRDIWRWRHGEVLLIQRLQAESFDARLVRMEDGRASWQIGPGHDEAADARPPALPLEGVPRFVLLQVRQGHVEVDDRPMQTRLQAELRGGEGADRPDGSPAGYQARVSGRWRALPMQLQVSTGSTLTRIQDGQAEGSAFELPLRVEGRAGAAQLLFDGSTSLEGDMPGLRGRLQLSGPSLAQAGAPLGLTLPQTPPFDLRGDLSLQGAVWRLTAQRAAIGRSLLDGEFRFDSGADPPLLSGRLGGTRLLLSDLAPAVGAPPATKPDVGDRPGRVLPQRRFDLPSLRMMDADLQVAIGELDFGSEAISPLRELRTQLDLKDGVLQLKGLQATVAGGQISGSTSLDPNQVPARWTADLAFRNVDIVGWLPGLRTSKGREQAPGRGQAALKQRRDVAREGGEQPVQAYLTGSLEGRAQVSGRGRSTAEILSTLDGNAQLALRDGTLSHLATEVAGLDLAQALGIVIRQDRPLPLRCARLDLQAREGVVRPRLAVLDNADSTLNMDGQVDLRDESLALRAVVHPKDFSPLTLRTPLVLGGTLGAPEPGVEGQRLAAKVLGALGLGVVAGPAAALLPLLDPGNRDAGDPCAAIAMPRPAQAAKAR